MRGETTFPGYPLEVRIGNGAPTLNTPHLAASVFLFQTWSEIMRLCVQTHEWAHWERPWGLFWFFEVHSAPLGHTQVLQRFFSSCIVLNPQCKTENMGMWTVRC